jgi:hypothetical protein
VAPTPVVKAVQSAYSGRVDTFTTSLISPDAALLQRLRLLLRPARS